jgi:hypothetical protein
MIELQLFRLRVVSPSQTTFLYKDHTPSVLIKEALEERPSKELRRGHHWHLGNVRIFGAEAVVFAIGRTTSSILERYDEATRDFVEEQLEAAPYTLAFLDTSLQVLAIAKKTRLMPTTEGIGRKLVALLHETAVARQGGFAFELLPLSDPDDFISYLQSAYAIRSFALGFHRPNPWDVDKDFQMPMERLLQETEGTKGKTLIEGETLSPEPLAELARSAAASGDDAEARVQMAKGQPTTKKRLRATNVTVLIESMTTDEDFEVVLERVREAYEAVRGKS